jgi:hypothetical protein
MSSKPRLAVFGAATVASLIGPIAALLTIWLPVASTIHVSDGSRPTQRVVARLRTNPSPDILRELRRVGASAPYFDAYDDGKIIAAADELFAGRFDLVDPPIAITLPFDGSKESFGIPGWDLQLSSFVVPALLARAYDITTEAAYLDGAVDYVIAWADFESSLLVPRGYVFNDHATAARAIVLTEVWRLYRDSPVYREDSAIDLVQYADRLRHLLSKPKFFEFRTNHGLMQSLSLLHLSIAFPELENTDRYTSLATKRLLSQVSYYLSAEGVILEHSAGYHHNGLRRLAAAWRYLGMLNVPVPDDLARRYERALDINVQLLRPDKTLPLFGDTGTNIHDSYPVAFLEHETGIASRLIVDDAKEGKPQRTTIAQAAGLAIFWSGLDSWPASAQLSQTVVHWGNFITQSHKHADEMGISIWASGHQWVRSIGGWPYDRSRSAATGWRSSNAPHWLGESRLAERETVLAGRATGDRLEFVEMVRSNKDGSTIRRQLLLIDGSHWLVVDDYRADKPRTAELLWRFAPDLSIEDTSKNQMFRIRSSNGVSLWAQLLGNEPWAIEADPDGTAAWNSGVVFDGEIVASPAIRGTSAGRELALATVITSHTETEIDQADFSWQSNQEWTLDIGSDGRGILRVERRASDLTISNSGNTARKLSIVSADADVQTLAAEENAFSRMKAKFGKPVSFRLERRMKISIAVVLAMLLQWLVFSFVEARLPKMRAATLALSFASWAGLCLFLQLYFLA